jgi:hypothetical protein
MNFVEGDILREIDVKQHRADHRRALNYAKRDAPASSIDTLIIREHRRKHKRAVYAIEPGGITDDSAAGMYERFRNQTKLCDW